jgi:hypothetical protein
MSNLLRLSDVNIEDVVKFLKPMDLKILLYLEDYDNETDIMLENMEYYFVEEELFEFAAVVRDEIKRRQNGTVI